MGSKTRRKKRERMWFKSPFCFVCQREIKNFADCTLEHIFPKSLGGSCKKYNLGISHRACNQIRGNNICRLLWQESVNEIIPDIEWKNRVYGWKIKLGYVQPKLPKIASAPTPRSIISAVTPKKMMKAWNEKYNLNEETI